MDSTQDYVLGIDPGWSSYGVALSLDGKLLFAANYCPKDFGTPHDFLKGKLFEDLNLVIRPSNIEHIFIERFVAYQGVASSASEDILMMIGATGYAFTELCYQCDIRYVRAIDWKQRICKYLVRTRQFSNPYPSFDKKYSLLVAKLLANNEDIRTNHEADAICLSYLKEVEDYERNSRKAKT